jgi:dihydroxyacetone kinase-like predicted kinase
MLRYQVEFILSGHYDSVEIVRETIQGLGTSLEIIPCEREPLAKGVEVKIRVVTDDPTLIFDTCAQFGRMKSIRVAEVV